MSLHNDISCIYVHVCFRVEEGGDPYLSGPMETVAPVMIVQQMATPLVYTPYLWGLLESLESNLTMTRAVQPK